MEKKWREKYGMGIKGFFFARSKPCKLCLLSHRIHALENYFIFNLFGILQEECIFRQDEDQRYYVECGVTGEKGKTKSRKGPNSPGDNKKRPNSQVSKT